MDGAPKCGWLLTQSTSHMCAYVMHSFLDVRSLCCSSVKFLHAFLSKDQILLTEEVFGLALQPSLFIRITERVCREHVMSRHARSGSYFSLATAMSFRHTTKCSCRSCEQIMLESSTRKCYVVVISCRDKWFLL